MIMDIDEPAFDLHRADSSSPPRLQGSSRLAGGFAHGKALGNNIADQSPTKETASLLVTALVHYIDSSDNPTMVELVAIKAEVCIEMTTSYSDLVHQIEEITFSRAGCILYIFQDDSWTAIGPCSKESTLNRDVIKYISPNEIHKVFHLYALFACYLLSLFSLYLD